MELYLIIIIWLVVAAIIGIVAGHFIAKGLADEAEDEAKWQEWSRSKGRIG